MQDPAITRGRRKIWLTFAAFVAVGIGFFIWLCNFSSILVVGPASKTHQRNPVWSPDGKYIAFECGYSYPSDGWDGYSFDNPNWDKRTSEICVFDIANGKTKRLTHGRYKSHPVWSPDGGALGWFDGSPNGSTNSFVLYDIWTRKKTKLSLPNTSCYRWWIDDVEYVQTDLGQSVLSPCHKLVLDLNSMQFTPSRFEQTDDETSIYSTGCTEISPDGQLVAKAAYPPRHTEESPFGFNLLVTKGGETLYESDFMITCGLEWSPDSKILAIDRVVNWDKREILVSFLYLPTKELIQFSESDIPAYQLYWSPKRNYIALKYDEGLIVAKLLIREKPFSVMVVEKRSFTLPQFTGDYLSWSFDEQFIASTSSEILEVMGEDWYKVAPEKIWLLDWENDSAPRLMDELYQSGVEK